MTEDPAERSRRAELALAAVVLALLALLALFLTDGTVLITRPYWVDELLTVFVANRPSPLAVIGDLGSGADGGASLFHLATWVIVRVAGAAPAVLRTLSLTCVLAALLVVYAVLRHRFTPLASAAGTLAVGANALVIEHSYEARFYGPWLLLCAATAALLARRQQDPGSRAAAIALAFASFFLCTIHFYGIITLGIMSAAIVASHGRRWRDGIRLVAPTAAGLLALVVVAPLALAQRRAYSVPSWLPDFRMAQATSLLADFWLTTIPLFAAVVIIAGIVIRARRDRGRFVSLTIRGAASHPGIVALMALSLMPVALGLLSAVGQPSMLPRYAIAAALSWGPWIALAAALGGRWVAASVLPVLVWYWFVGYTKEARMKTSYAQALSQAAHAYQQARIAGGPAPIVFPSIHVMYPLVSPDAGRDNRAVFLDVPDATFHALFPDSTRLGQTNRVVVLERDLARVHARRFGFPRLMSQASLDSVPRFLLLVPEGRLPAGFSGVAHYAQTLFPRHKLTRLLADLSLVERTEAGPSSK